jgi:hypothetical protein
MVENRRRQKRATAVEQSTAPRLSPADIAARARALELAREAELVSRALSGREGRSLASLPHRQLRDRFTARQWQNLVAEGQRRLEADKALFRALAVMSRPAKPWSN